MTTKAFDAVKFMREARDRLSREMEPMTAEERIAYIRKKAELSGLGKQESASGEASKHQQDA